MGRVTAIELDAGLAARATANFAQMPHIRAVHGNGTRVMLEPAYLIYVNAGAARPADAWLYRLKEGGRLILPLTADGFPNRDVRRGVVFRIERRGPELLCAGSLGSRSFLVKTVVTRPAGRVLAAAFHKGGAERATRLYRRDDLPEDNAGCARPAGAWLTADAPDISHPAGPGRGGGSAVGSLFPLEGGMGLRSGVHGTDARRPRGRSGAHRCRRCVDRDRGRRTDRRRNVCRGNKQMFDRCSMLT
jgi:hypothetical protein